jgi:hypothetical protein
VGQHHRRGLPGRAYYSDISVVPNVDDDKVQSCPTAAGHRDLRRPGPAGARRLAERLRLGQRRRRGRPGIFGPSNLPHLIRDDFVHNGNDSYWLSNPHEPLEGFARIIGDERAERTLRTRIGLVMVEERLAGEDPHGDVDPAAGDRWSKENLKAAMFDNRQYAGELMRDDLVELCESLPGTISTSGPPASTEGACEALADWDLRDELDSTGAILFRRFLANLQGMASPVGDPTGTGLLGLPWREGFDVDDPVHTPNTLNTADPRVAIALGDAINDLEGAGIPLDAPLGEWQYVERDGGRIPIHGGPGSASLFNAINVRVAGRPRRGPPATRTSPRLLVRDGRHLVRRPRRVPGAGRRAGDLRPVGEPDLGALRRPDPPVLGEGLGPDVLLRAGRARGRQARHQAGRVVGRSRPQPGTAGRTEPRTRRAARRSGRRRPASPVPPQRGPARSSCSRSSPPGSPER